MVFKNILKLVRDKFGINIQNLEHVKIPNKTFETLTYNEISSMIRALYTDQGNEEFDQWALLEFHSIKAFKNERVQCAWNIIDLSLIHI